MEPSTRANAIAPGRTRFFPESRWLRSRTRFTTEAEEGNSGGWWTGEQANIPCPSGTRSGHLICTTFNHIRGPGASALALKSAGGILRP